MSYRTWTRVIFSVPSIGSISPVTVELRRSGWLGIPLASRAPPRVPVSQPPVAATTWSSVVGIGSAVWLP
jgi:hypothetical protein